MRTLNRQNIAIVLKFFLSKFLDNFGIITSVYSRKIQYSHFITYLPIKIIMIWHDVVKQLYWYDSVSFVIDLQSTKSFITICNK